MMGNIRSALSPVFVPVAICGCLLLGVLTAPSASAGSAKASRPDARCPYSGVHYYAEGYSGYGSNKGTGADMRTWTHWSLNGHSDGFSDEAVWAIDYNNGNNALEVGFNTGAGNVGVFSNAMYPYWTINNGGDEHDYTSDALPTNTVIWNSATSDGTHSWAYVNNHLLQEISYGVQTPRWNYEQAEVNYHDIWMGGGSGSNVAAEYQTSSNSWYDWGYIHGSSDTEYHYTIQLYQPNGAVEGGYGVAC
jgi:hypothetical protein